MTQPSHLCGPALVFLILAVLVLCACVVAGRASDNADRTEDHLCQ
jgi:hypothetical protein